VPRPVAHRHGYCTGQLGDVILRAARDTFQTYNRPRMNDISIPPPTGVSSSHGVIMSLSPLDLTALQRAKTLLENPGFAAQVTNVVGAPIEAALKRLPDGVHRKLGDAIEGALLKVATGAARTMKDTPGDAPSTKLHTLGAAVSGGVGGFFGAWALLAEVPVTTGIIFRSIADIARSEGESVKDAATLLACVEVFALGGESDDDDAFDSGYYAVRAAMTQQVKAATDFLTKAGTDSSTPALVALIKKVAERLGVAYTEKLAAQLVPVVGAVGGAAVNLLFITHFQNMARGHFVVRRLERQYGVSVVQDAYKALPLKG
jgi:hypothetical protein